MRLSGVIESVRPGHLFDEHWRSSLAAPFTGLSVSAFVGWLLSVNWSVVIGLIGVAITSIGGAIIGLRTHHRLAKITVRMREVELEMMERKLRELPVEQLNPNEVAREAAAIEGAKCDGSSTTSSGLQ